MNNNNNNLLKIKEDLNVFYQDLNKIKENLSQITKDLDKLIENLNNIKSNTQNITDISTSESSNQNFENSDDFYDKTMQELDQFWKDNPDLLDENFYPFYNNRLTSPPSITEDNQVTINPSSIDRELINRPDNPSPSNSGLFVNQNLDIENQENIESINSPDRDLIYNPNLKEPFRRIDFSVTDIEIMLETGDYDIVIEFMAIYGVPFLYNFGTRSKFFDDFEKKLRKPTPTKKEHFKKNLGYNIKIRIKIVLFHHNDNYDLAIGDINKTLNDYKGRVYLSGAILEFDNAHAQYKTAIRN